MSKVENIRIYLKKGDLETKVHELALSQLLSPHIKVDNNEHVIGGYCGDLSSSNHVLEQLLLLLREERALHVFLLDTEECLEEKTFLFTSLFSWHDYDLILAEHNALAMLQGKVLKIIQKEGETRTLRLNLLHQNLSASAWTPAETKAHLKDINDEMLIGLLPLAWRFLSLPGISEIENLSLKLQESQLEKDFYIRQRGILKAIDQFRKNKKELLHILESSVHEVAIALTALLREKKLSQIDAYLFTGILTRHLGILHNTNNVR